MYERNVSHVEALVTQQNEWRGRCINLIASENVTSRRVRGVMGSDFAHRYAEGHPGERYYQGTEIIDEIESLLKKQLKTLFHCRQVDVRPISGTVANDAVFSRYISPGDVVMVNSTPAGGHIGHHRAGSVGKYTHNIIDFPLTADGMVYSIEGELVVHGPAALPLGLRLGPSAAVPGVRLRYAVGLMAADQVLFRTDGVLDGPTVSASWMLSLRPEGGDAAVPVRAVFAVRAEGDDPTACRQAMKGLSAAIIASSDGRVALAERAKDASEWLKPLPMYIPAAQLGAGPPPGKAEGKKADKKADGGGHH
jgi:hypothetical protein